MNREDLKEKIDKKIWEAIFETKAPQPTLEQIMLFIDQYVESRETPPLDEIWTEYITSSIIACQAQINVLKMRQGWTDELIREELELFLEREYPKQDAEEHKIRKHFFNYIRKRKPEQQDKASKAQNWFNT